MTSLDFCELDVFASDPLSGNPLAVIAGADELPDEVMQRLAAWTGLSETTFLMRPTSPDADYRVRIFTPTTEYPFAGHPTLGSARAWLELGGVPRQPGIVHQECGVGVVPVRVDAHRLWFATPPRTRTGPLSDADLTRIAEVLGIDGSEIIDHAWGTNGPVWRLVQLRDAETVRRVRPRSDRGDLRFGMVGFEAAGSETAYEVRALGERHEDPVTGGLHGAMAQWLRERGSVPASYVAAQGSQVGRRGRVHVADDGSQIWIGGRVDVVVRGRIDLPDR